MYMRNLLQLVRTLARPRLAAGVLVTLALLSAACSNDSASRINAPPLLASASHSSDGQPPTAIPPAAASFAVLAGTAVDCTRSTVIGQVGIYPGSAFTPVNCITGAVHAGDAQLAVQAFLDLYASVAGTPCDFTLTGTLNKTLTTPGVYCFDAGVTTTDGTLTLIGPPNGIWIFKIGTLGTGELTGTDFSVFIPGGNPCNVTWWVAQGATITDDDAGVPHPFVGTILAGAAISTTGTNAAPTDRLSFTGNAYAKAAVTLTDTNITGCAAASRGNGKDDDKGDRDNDNDRDKDKHHDRDKDKHNDRDNDRRHGDSNDHRSSDREGGNRGGH